MYVSNLHQDTTDKYYNWCRQHQDLLLSEPTIRKLFYWKDPEENLARISYPIESSFKLKVN